MSALRAVPDTFGDDQREAHSAALRGVSVTVAPIAPAIAFLAPMDDTPEVRELRGKLSKARDVASREIGRWQGHCDAARQLYVLIAQTACAHVFAAESEHRLDLAVRACRQMLIAAQSIDHLERNANEG